jgi:hypothetical protein
LPDISAAWTVLAGLAVALTLASAAGTILAAARLWRLWADHRVIEAAERFEAVNLTSVVKRHVPPALQSQRAAEEMAIAKQIIASRWPRWKRTALISGIVMLCGATAAAYSIHRDMKAATAAQMTVKPALNLDALKDIQGVWGWRADSLQSCSENPQTISVAPDRKTLSIRYAKPFHSGSRTITSVDLDIISAAPDMLVLSRSGPAEAGKPPPPQVYFRFIDANAFTLSNSNDQTGSSGTIARC